MTWFKVDDSFYDHPKVYDAPDSAVALWLRAGAWSARNLTDGFVPTGMPARLCDDPERAVKELLDRGLWKRARNGYRFHDWSHYQPTKEEALAGRDGMSSGGALGNHRRWHIKAGKTDPKCRYCADLVNKHETQKPIGSVSGTSSGRQTESHRPDTPRNSYQGEQDRVRHRPTDRVPDGAPEAEPNPPARPVPASTGGRSSSLSYDRAGEAPPPRCPKHLDTEDPPNCGPCGDARRARTRWDLADAERRRTTPQCQRHRGQPADNCALCRSEALGDS